MNNITILKYSIDFLDSIILVTDKMIDFYINYGFFDEKLKDSISFLLEGFEILIANFPPLISGKMNGRNFNNELITSLNFVQTYIIYPYDDVDNLRLHWQKFSILWKDYSITVHDLIANNRFMYIYLN